MAWGWLGGLNAEPVRPRQVARYRPPGGAGKRSNSVDHQVRHFASGSRDQVTARLKREPPVAYKNRYGQKVRWVLNETVATEFNPCKCHTIDTFDACSGAFGVR